MLYSNTSGVKGPSAVGRERMVELGERLREVRKARGFSLQQVADLANLSKGFVSQVESGTTNPSIASLKRIATVLDTPLGALFGPESNGEGAQAGALAPPPETGDVRIVRRDRRKMLAWPGAQMKTYMLTPDLQRKLEVTLNVYDPGGQSGDEPLVHEGEEFGVVLEGRIEVTIGDHTHVLEVGDSIYFPSNLPHRTRALDGRPAQTLWVGTPPSF
jgi:transcriptional regulator with XRE-family HTH domain